MNVSITCFNLSMMTFDNTTDFLIDLKAQVNGLDLTSNYDQLLVILEDISVAVVQARQYIASMKNRLSSISDFFQ